jgi:uroporphyrinogen-III synthase
VAYAVITRDEAAVARYAAALAPLGLDVIALPVTRTAPARDPGALGRAIAHGNYAAIVVASAQAAAAVQAARGDAVLPEVWAVGPATARALAAAGIAAEVPAVARDARALAEALIAQRAVAGRRVLVPRAEDGRDEAIAVLRAAGVEVDVVTAYRTVATPHDAPELARGLAVLRRGESAVCAVFAPSQVEALDALVAVRAIAARFVAIGATTAAALRDAGVAAVAVADAPTPEGLAKAVSAVYPQSL